MRFYNHRGLQGRHPERRRFGYQDGDQDLFLRYRHGNSRGGFGGQGEGKRRFFERGAFKFALLELLASEPMHGYQLIKAMEEKTGGLYTPSPGSVFPNLQLLEDMKLIGCSETEGKKLYHITDEGLAYLGKTRHHYPIRSYCRMTTGWTNKSLTLCPNNQEQSGGRFPSEGAGASFIFH